MAMEGIEILNFIHIKSCNISCIKNISNLFSSAEDRNRLFSHTLLDKVRNPSLLYCTLLKESVDTGHLIYSNRNSILGMVFSGIQFSCKLRYSIHGVSVLSKSHNGK